MSFLITRVVRVNGEERQRSTVPADYTSMDKMEIPVATIHPPLHASADIELELIFDPPLSPLNDSQEHEHERG